MKVVASGALRSCVEAMANASVSASQQVGSRAGDEKRTEGDDPERGKAWVGLDAGAEQNFPRQVDGAADADAGQQTGPAGEAGVTAQAVRESGRR